MLKTSESTAKLVSALHEVQGDVRGVGKKGKNPHFRSSYATLEAVIAAIQEACQEHGIVFQQFVGPLGQGSITVITRISHVSGEWQECTAELPMIKNDPQQAGSAITYARRYSLIAAFGLPALDDDAELAMGRDKKPAKAEPAKVEPVKNEPVSAAPIAAAEAQQRKYSSAAEAKKDHWPDFKAEVDKCETRDELVVVWNVLKAGKKNFPSTYWDGCFEDILSRAEELGLELRAA